MGEVRQEWSWKGGSPEKRANVERFIEWTLTPEALRDPPSKQKLADAMGVHINTLRNYQREPAFQRQVTERARAIARVDRLPAILDSLFVQASDPTSGRSVSAARLLLDFMMTAEDKQPTIDPKKMDQSELVKTALELLHKAQGEPVTS